MFDMGFWELAMIMLVALVVIGPERLPGIAKRIGLYLGKAQRMLATVKDEVNREIAAEELKKTLEKQAGASGGEFEFLSDARKDLEDIQASLNERVDADPPGTHTAASKPSTAQPPVGSDNRIDPSASGASRPADKS